MQHTLRMEQASLGHLVTMAAQAGCVVEAVHVDDDGVDVTVKRRGKHRHVTSPRIEVQLKSTSNLIEVGTRVKFDLDIPTFGKLKDPDVVVPRLLVLLHLPKRENDWTFYRPDHVLLRHRAYWFNPYQWGVSINKKAQRVSTPKSNVLTSSTLVRLMHRVTRHGFEAGT